jgi:hypothetical protein
MRRMSVCAMAPSKPTIMESIAGWNWIYVSSPMPAGKIRVKVQISA